MTRKTATPAEAALDVRTYRILSAATGHPAPVFVLLHGIGLSHRIFNRLGQALSQTGNVVGFDLPGFGPTRHPDRQLSIEDHSAIICAELDRLNTGPVILVGHSMGAQFAIDVARREPRNVCGVVLIGPVLDEAHRTLRAQTLRLIRDALLEPPGTQLTVAFDYARCGIPWFLLEASAMRDYPTHENIKDINKPILIIRGQHDPIAGPSWVARLAELSQNARVTTIPGKRHNVVHSGADTVAEAITLFVKTL